MDASPAELSSLSSALEDLSSRITAIADAYNSAGRDDVATELVEVDRQITGGQRRLARLLTTFEVR